MAAWQLKLFALVLSVWFRRLFALIFRMSQLVSIVSRMAFDEQHESVIALTARRTAANRSSCLAFEAVVVVVVEILHGQTKTQAVHSYTSRCNRD